LAIAKPLPVSFKNFANPNIPPAVGDFFCAEGNKPEEKLKHPKGFAQAEK